MSSRGTFSPHLLATVQEWHASFGVPCFGSASDSGWLKNLKRQPFCLQEGRWISPLQAAMNGAFPLLCPSPTSGFESFWVTTSGLCSALPKVQQSETDMTLVSFNVTYSTVESNSKTSQTCSVHFVLAQQNPVRQQRQWNTQSANSGRQHCRSSRLQSHKGLTTIGRDTCAHTHTHTPSLYGLKGLFCNNCQHRIHWPRETPLNARHERGRLVVCRGRLATVLGPAAHALLGRGRAR